MFSSLVYFASIVALKGLKVQNFNVHHSEVTLRPSDASFESVFSSVERFCASGLEQSVLVSHLPSQWFHTLPSARMSNTHTLAAGVFL